MESILIKMDFESIQECIDFSNNLIGNPVPGYDSWIAVRVIQFQIIHSYTIVLLIAVEIGKLPVT